MTSWLAPGELGQLSWSWRMEESGISHKLACLWVSPSILEPLSPDVLWQMLPCTLGYKVPSWT